MALAGLGARPPAIVVVKPQPSHFWYVSGGPGDTPTPRARAPPHFGHTCGVSGVGIRGAIPRQLQVRFLSHQAGIRRAISDVRPPLFYLDPPGYSFAALRVGSVRRDR